MGQRALKLLCLRFSNAQFSEPHSPLSKSFWSYHSSHIPLKLSKWMRAYKPGVHASLLPVLGAPLLLSAVEERRRKWGKGGDVKDSETLMPIDVENIHFHSPSSLRKKSLE
jgi:hypothetical protein